jgi:hypothetical protein
VADLLGDAYAGGLRDVFLVCAAAAILGGLAVLALVNAAAPAHGHGAPQSAGQGAGQPQGAAAGAH